MRLLWTIFYRELLRIPKMKYFYWKRFSFLLFICIMFFFQLSFTRAISGSYGGSGLFLVTFIVSLVFMASIFVPPVNAARSIYEEKEKKTLPLLLITDLRSYQIIYGKFMFRSFQGMLLFLSCLPIVLFSISLGGISGIQILAVLASLLSFIFLATAIGLTAASIFNNEKTSGIAFGLTMFYVLIGSWLQQLFSSPGGTWLPLSTMTCFSITFSQGLVAPCFWNAAIQIVLSFLLLHFGSLFLPNAVLYEKAAKDPKSIKKRLSFWRKPITETRRILKSKSRKTEEGSQVSQKVLSNPVFWRDYNKIYGGRKKRFLQLALLTALWLGLSLFMAIDSSYFHFEDMMGMGVGIFAFATFFSILINCVRSFGREKDQRTLDVLLCSDLSNLQIVLGKIAAILWFNLYRILFIAVCICWLVVEEGGFRSLRDFYEFLIGFSYFGSLLLALFSLAIYASMRCKTAKKAGNLVGITIFLLYFGHTIGLVFVTMAFRAFVDMAVIGAIFTLLYLLATWIFISQTVMKLRIANQ